jgi:hypothetical protein
VELYPCEYAEAARATSRDPWRRFEALDGVKYSKE